MSDKPQTAISIAAWLLCVVIITVVFWFLFLRGPYVGQTFYFPNGTSAKIAAINGDVITLDRQPIP